MWFWSLCFWNVFTDFSSHKKLTSLGFRFNKRLESPMRHCQFIEGYLSASNSGCSQTPFMGSKGQWQWILGEHDVHIYIYSKLRLSWQMTYDIYDDLSYFNILFLSVFRFDTVYVLTLIFLRTLTTNCAGDGIHTNHIWRDDQFLTRKFLCFCFKRSSTQTISTKTTACL